MGRETSTNKGTKVGKQNHTGDQKRAQFAGPYQAMVGSSGQSDLEQAIKGLCQVKKFVRY